MTRYSCDRKQIPIKVDQSPYPQLWNVWLDVLWKNSRARCFVTKTRNAIISEKTNETSCWSAVSLHVPKTAKSIFASFTHLRHVQNRYPTLENTCMYKQCLELSKGLSKKAGTQWWIAAESLLKKDVRTPTALHCGSFIFNEFHFRLKQRKLADVSRTFHKS